MIIPAGSNRRASQPPFWRIFQLDRAVGPPNPVSKPPENTKKWVFKSKKPASRRASKPPFWRIFRLDRAVGPPSPCPTPPENTTKWVFQSKTRKPPSIPAPILANFPARSGRRASQPLSDAAGKYGEVGIPVENPQAAEPPSPHSGEFSS